MSVNYTPNQNSYKNMGAFRFWCQKILPMVYDDSLSYYEVLNKLVVHLNDVINNANAMGTDITNLYKSYVLLQEYVNGYFDNLDVQVEINNKLDNMASNGSLSALIQPLFDLYKTEVEGVVTQQNANIENQNNRVGVLEARMSTFTKLEGGSTTGDAELTDARVDIYGVTHDTVGDAIRSQVSVVGAVTDACKNQFGLSFTANKLLNPNGSEATFGGFMVSGFIPCYPSGDFTYNCETKNQYTQAVCFYDVNKKFISGISNIGTNGVDHRGVTPDNCWYMKICVANANVKTAKCYMDKPIMPEWIIGVSDTVDKKLDKHNVGLGLSFVDGYIYTYNNKHIVADGFIVSDYIPCYPSANLVYSGESNNSNVYGVAFYDQNKNFVSGLSRTGENQTELTCVVPEGCWYVRVTGQPNKGETYAYVSSPVFHVWVNELREYVNQRLAGGDGENAIKLEHIESLVVTKPVGVIKADTLLAGGNLVIPDQTSVNQNTSCRFFAKLDNVGDFVMYIGNGENKTATYGEYVRITPTHCSFMSNGSSGGNIEHNITEFKDYIFISLSINKNEKCDLRIETNGGSYFKGDVDYPKHSGKIFFEVESGATLSNCELTWNCSDFKKDVWLFGDSYFNYWNKYLRSWGYNTVLLNAYPGETSAGGLRDFKGCLKYGTPQYAVWCLGMNDKDTTSEPNSSWLSCVNEFLSICDEKNITPILATIPCTTNTNVKNENKNNWVRNSGRRYVDFADALNATVDGSSWYNGMLSSDNVHPTNEGSMCIASKLLLSVPEIQHE